VRFQWLVWPLFAAIMGFALGGSVFWALYGPNATIQHVSQDAEHQSTDHEAKSKKEETDEALAYYTLWLMVFTGILAAATLGLGVATFGLYVTGEKQIANNAKIASEQSRDMRRSIRAAEKAADAALLNAKAAIGIELPFLRIEPMRFGNGTTRNADDSLRLFFVIATIKISNTGRTKAIPIEIRCGWTFGKELPLEPVYPWWTGFKTDAVIQPEPAEPMEYWLHELEMDVPDDAYEQLRSRTANFWFYAELVYLDFMGTRQSACFCWRRIESFGVGSFAIDDTPAYNRKT
jgi:hypothetical protein